MRNIFSQQGAARSPESSPREIKNSIKLQTATMYSGVESRRVSTAKRTFNLDLIMKCSNKLLV